MASKIFIQHEHDDADASFFEKIIKQAFMLEVKDSCLAAVTDYTVNLVGPGVAKLCLQVDLNHKSIHFQEQRFKDAMRLRPGIVFEVMFFTRKEKGVLLHNEMDAAIVETVPDFHKVIHQVISHVIMVRYQGYVMEALVKKVIEDHCAKKTQFIGGIIFEEVFYSVQYQDLQEKVDLQIIFRTDKKKHVLKFGVKSSLFGLKVSRKKHNVPQLGIENFEVSDFQIAQGVARLALKNLKQRVSIAVTTTEICALSLLKSPVLVSS